MFSHVEVGAQKPVSAASSAEGALRTVLTPTLLKDLNSAILTTSATHALSAFQVEGKHSGSQQVLFAFPHYSLTLTVPCRIQLER